MDFTKRIDLHCHSRASTEADEAMLQAIGCPESYSQPRQIYAQAKSRGMDFVTITDHDSIAGVAELTGLADVLVGEELTCYFPEDRCKIHLLLWGIMQADHDALQRLAGDIYAVARYVAKHGIAHAVAHPLYRQNGVLDRRHVERLILLFNGFECLNGAHSMTHREVFEPLLDDLDAAEIRRLERAHGLDAVWAKPWMKTRTAGSDDHGLFNIGRTWTEFPAQTQTVDQVLQCLREGRCRPGGEAGSSIKLAHNFYGVGMRYYARQLAGSTGGGAGHVIRRMLGEAGPMSRLSAAAALGGACARGIRRKIGRFLGFTKPARGTKLLGELLSRSAMKHGPPAGALLRAMKEGRSPLAEHRPMFELVCRMDRDVAGGIFDAMAAAIGDGELGVAVDAISAVIAHQALLLPYLFALFHQNQERDLLNRLSKRSRSGGGDFPRVGVFTDVADESTVAGRFVADLAHFAESRGLSATIHLLSREPEITQSWKHFAPMIGRKIAAFGARLKIPPVLEVLEWSDRRQFDVILVNTVGPMGLCGWLASKMLRAPMVAVCHDDLPARIQKMTGGDYRLTAALEAYVAWLYRSAAKVLTSGQGAAKISGIRQRRLPADDPLDSVWDACVQAALQTRGEDESTPKEAMPA
jgi:hypothetical protein